MEEQFDAVLTGTDSPIEGTVTQTSHDEYGDAYLFQSLDDSLRLLIARGNYGHWVRVSGTDPYLTGWVDELAEQIQARQQQL